jgi:hypothetical protein
MRIILGERIQPTSLFTNRAQQRDRLHIDLGGSNDEFAHLQHARRKIAKFEETTFTVLFI